ncbi:MAG TPA: hypothetical protein VH682_24575 [Gemmataceae bacterium]|jgi:hypothetical protein
MTYDALRSKSEHGPCLHSSRAYYRQTWSNGNGQHVIEACVRCGANMRGSGRWVPRAEVLAVGIDVDLLPLAPAKREEQLPLFVEGEGVQG